MSVEVGQKAPDIALVGADRKPVQLADVIAGKPAVLVFFPAAFSGVCTKEMCSFRDSFARFRDVSSQVVGISVDSPFAQTGFAQVNHIEFPLLSDFNRRAVRAFGIEDPSFAGGQLPGVAKRSVFVLDKEGIVRWKWIAEAAANEPDYDAVAEAAKRAS
jgi:peroxiredoxin